METTEKRHALLSPSAAHRWLECTPSAVAEAKVPDESSAYAVEGSLAHAIAALELLARLGRAGDAQVANLRQEIATLTNEHGGAVTPEMGEYARDYADRIMARYQEELQNGPAEVHVETELWLDQWVPGSFGTSDAVVIGRDRISVFDYKYGRGVRVDAHNNPQMRMYALGALDEFALERYLTEVRMEIIQPRLGAFTCDEMTVAELTEWGVNVLMPLAEVASRGLGGRKAGNWCRFCRAFHGCPMADMLARAALNTDVDRESPESLGEVCLPAVPVLEKWIEDVRGRALGLMRDGVSVPGYKVVRKRTQRRVSDPAGMTALLVANGFAESDITRSSLKPLGELEKLVGKKRFSDLAKDFIVKPEGELTIAEDSDARPVETHRYFSQINIE